MAVSSPVRLPLGASRGGGGGDSHGRGPYVQPLSHTGRWHQHAPAPHYDASPWPSTASAAPSRRASVSYSALNVSHSFSHHMDGTPPGPIAPVSMQQSVGVSSDATEEKAPTTPFLKRINSVSTTPTPVPASNPRERLPLTRSNTETQIVQSLPDNAPRASPVEQGSSQRRETNAMHAVDDDLSIQVPPMHGRHHSFTFDQLRVADIVTSSPTSSNSTSAHSTGSGSGSGGNSEMASRRGSQSGPFTGTDPPASVWDANKDKQQQPQQQSQQQKQQVQDTGKAPASESEAHARSRTGSRSSLRDISTDRATKPKLSQPKMEDTTQTKVIPPLASQRPRRTSLPTLPTLSMHALHHMAPHVHPASYRPLSREAMVKAGMQAAQMRGRRGSTPLVSVSRSHLPSSMLASKTRRMSTTELGLKRLGGGTSTTLALSIGENSSVSGSLASTQPHSNIASGRRNSLSTRSISTVSEIGDDNHDHDDGESTDDVSSRATLQRALSCTSITHSPSGSASSTSNKHKSEHRRSRSDLSRLDLPPAAAASTAAAMTSTVHCPVATTDSKDDAKAAIHEPDAKAGHDTSVNVSSKADASANEEKGRVDDSYVQVDGDTTAALVMPVAPTHAARVLSDMHRRAHTPSDGKNESVADKTEAEADKQSLPLADTHDQHRQPAETDTGPATEKLKLSINTDDNDDDDDDDTDDTEIAPRPTLRSPPPLQLLDSDDEGGIIVNIDMADSVSPATATHQPTSPSASWGDTNAGSSAAVRRTPKLVQINVSSSYASGPGSTSVSGAPSKRPFINAALPPLSPLRGLPMSPITPPPYRPSPTASYRLSGMGAGSHFPGISPRNGLTSSERVRRKFWVNLPPLPTAPETNLYHHHHPPSHLQPQLQPASPHARGTLGMSSSASCTQTRIELAALDEHRTTTESEGGQQDEGEGNKEEEGHIQKKDVDSQQGDMMQLQSTHPVTPLRSGTDSAARGQHATTSSSSSPFGVHGSSGHSQSIGNSTSSSSSATPMPMPTPSPPAPEAGSLAHRRPSLPIAQHPGSSVGMQGSISSQIPHSPSPIPFPSHPQSRSPLPPTHRVLSPSLRPISTARSPPTRHRHRRSQSSHVFGSQGSMNGSLLMLPSSHSPSRSPDVNVMHQMNASSQSPEALHPPPSTPPMQQLYTFPTPSPPPHSTAADDGNSGSAPTSSPDPDAPVGGTHNDVLIGHMQQSDDGVHLMASGTRMASWEPSAPRHSQENDQSSASAPPVVSYITSPTRALPMLSPSLPCDDDGCPFSPEHIDTDSLYTDPLSPHNGATRSFLRMATHPLGRAYLTRTSSQALLAFCQTLLKIATSETLDRWRRQRKLRRHLTLDGICAGTVAAASGVADASSSTSSSVSDTLPPLINCGPAMGLHIGWAIEGAIGSRHKIDCSYLSPDVNLSSRLAAACKQYYVPLLFSEQFFKLLPTLVRDRCRMVDRVTLKGSSRPMTIYTFDIWIPHHHTTHDTRGRAGTPPQVNQQPGEKLTNTDRKSASNHDRASSRRHDAPSARHVNLSINPMPASSPPAPSASPTVVSPTLHDATISQHVHASLDAELAALNATRHGTLNTEQHQPSMAAASTMRPPKGSPSAHYHPRTHRRRRSHNANATFETDGSNQAASDTQVEWALMHAQQEQAEAAAVAAAAQQAEFDSQMARIAATHAQQSRDLAAVFDVSAFETTTTTDATSDGGGHRQGQIHVSLPQTVLSPSPVPPPTFTLPSNVGPPSLHTHAATSATAQSSPSASHAPVSPPPPLLPSIRSISDDPLLHKLLYILLWLQRSPPHPLFTLTHNAATRAYIRGEWNVAGQLYEQVQRWNPSGGPSRILHAHMAKHGFKAPDDWAGYRKLEKK